MPVGVARGLALLGALGCVEPALELGTGEVEFVPLADGDRIDVVNGPQGGFHVVAAIRARGIPAGDPDDLAASGNPTVSFTVTAEGRTWQRGDLVSFRQGLERHAEDGWTHRMLNRFVILDITDDDALHGKEIELAVRLEAADGTTWEDARRLDARRHPANP